MTFSNKLDTTSKQGELAVWSVGVVFILIADILWQFIITNAPPRYIQLLQVLYFVYPALVAGLVAFFSPRNKILLGGSMVLVVGIMSLISSTIGEYIDLQTDAVGFFGNIYIASLLIFYQVIPCIIGSFIGKWCASKPQA